MRHVDWLAATRCVTIPRERISVVNMGVAADVLRHNGMPNTAALLEEIREVVFDNTPPGVPVEVLSVKEA